MNDVVDDKHRVGTGTLVEFELEQGQRGPKASSVRIVGSPVSAGPSAGGAQVDEERGSYESESLCDVLSTAEFFREVTELLIAVEPTLTGAQMLPVRREFARFAQRHGWIED